MDGDEVSMEFEDDRDPTKPYKVVRALPDGQVRRVAEYATEAEAMSHVREGRRDWNYRIYIGGRQLWPVKE